MAKLVGLSLVAMTALAFGTKVGPHGNILHTDPEGLDERAREPLVTEEEADFLEAEKLAVRKGKKLPADPEVGSFQTDIERQAEEDRQRTLINAGDGGGGTTKVATAPKPAAKGKAAGGKKTPAPKPAKAAEAPKTGAEAAVVTGEGSKDTDPDVPEA